MNMRWANVLIARNEGLLLVSHTHTRYVSRLSMGLIRAQQHGNTNQK